MRLAHVLALAGALGIARGQQVNKEGWAEHKKALAKAGE